MIRSDLCSPTCTRCKMRALACRRGAGRLCVGVIQQLG